MARNPLFGLFSRALRSATLANRRGMPINELVELTQRKRKKGLDGVSSSKQQGHLAAGCC